MLVYDINELAVIYDTLEFLKNNYDVTVQGIVGAKSVKYVKNLINTEIEKLIKNSKDQNEIKKLKSYILK